MPTHRHRAVHDQAAAGGAARAYGGTASVQVRRDRRHGDDQRYAPVASSEAMPVCHHAVGFAIPPADSATLADYGIVGKKRSEAPDSVVVWYNFVPHAHDDALLLVTHTRERVGVT